MAVDLALNLPPDPSAPGLARTAAKRLLDGGVGPERLSDLSLVISELVSNALVHGCGQVVFRLQLDEGIVRGEVIDQGGGFEHEVRARGPEEVSGRGLLLVEALTHRWGIHEGTSHVWFELPARSAASRPPRPRLGQDERPDALDCPEGGRDETGSRSGPCDTTQHDASSAKHRALLYEDPTGFADGVGAFALEGLRAGDHVLAALTGQKRRWIEDRLGDEADRIEFLDAGAFYERHGVMFRELLGSLARHATPGQGRLRVIAEQALALREPADARDYMRYEAASNVAFDRYDVAVLCPYDAARLPAELLEAALETHPEVFDGGGARRSERFVDPRTFLRRHGQSPGGPADVAPHRIERPDDISTARAIMTARGRAAGLDRLSVEELALAVSEVATNALLHGRAPRRVRSYVADGRFICRLEDAGSGLQDPLAGYVPPDPSSLGGRGLWLARQLCDVVEIASDAAGTSVSLHVRLPGAA